ncbi:MAG: hypothetical protein AB7E21_14300 [Pseudodonghicola sp.]
MTEASATPAFADLQDRLNALRQREAIMVTAGHADLAEGMWLSCDPQGQAEMGCHPEDQGFRLTASGTDSGAWASFGLRLPLEILARGRYLGLLIDAAPRGIVSFSPSLRYRFRDGGLQDVGTPDPVVLPDGPQTHLIHIPLDPGLLERAAECELNLYFHSNQVDMLVTRMEMLLMV